MTRRSLLQMAALPVLAAQSEIRVILIGDDIGAVHAIGDATIACYKNGIMRSANLIVPGPWLHEAAELLNANPGLDVGIHLALNSEWDAVKWRPLTPALSFVDANGYLPPRTKDVTVPTVKLADVEREIRAQIEMGKKMVPRVSWLSAHMGAVTATPALAELTRKLSDEYKMPMQGDIPGVVRHRTPYSNTSTPDEKVKAMVGWLEGLPPGIHSMIDHPALDTPEMRRVFHVGNTNVAEQRAGVMYAWTHADLKAAVKRRGIVLTSVGASVKRA